MKASIGIITAEKSMDKIRQIQPILDRDCQVTYLPYSSLPELYQLYQSSCNRFDGLLFSGALPYDAVKNSVGLSRKPQAYFEVADRDYYKIIAQLAVSRPDLDFSRVLIEKPRVEVDWEGIFSPETMPIIRSANPFEWNHSTESSDNSIYNHIFAFYSSLYQDGRIDLVVTRTSNLVPSLKAAGIPHVLLFPSPASMTETFNDLLHQIQSNRFNDSLTAMAIVSAAGEPLTGSRDAILQKALSVFNERSGMSFVIRKNHDVYELTTSNAILQEQTTNCTSCRLTSFLKEMMDFPTCVGWGTGMDAIEAQRNAAKAVRESQYDCQHLAYVVTVRGEVIGPLSSNRSLIYNNVPSGQADRLSKVLSMSPLNVQKLISILEKRDSNRLSSEELAYYLNITQRSAGRILSKLVERGGAVVVQNEQINFRGRPAKIYELRFNELDLDLRGAH